MKKWFVVLMLLVWIPVNSWAACTCECAGYQQMELPVFDGNQQLVFETIRREAAFPKNAQVLSAMEYFCKIEGYQLHLMLIHATQSEQIEMMFGFGASIMIVDLDNGNVYTYQNIAYPEGQEVTCKEDTIRFVYGGFDSVLNGYGEYVYSDAEMTYPLTDEEMTQINEALAAFFAQ